jgi:HAMP domain-containing protein
VTAVIVALLILTVGVACLFAGAAWERDHTRSIRELSDELDAAMTYVDHLAREVGQMRAAADRTQR